MRVRFSPVAPMKYLLLLCGLLCFAPTKSQAQFWDPDNKWTCWSCYDHNWHFSAGAALDVSTRLPLFAWRKTVIGRIGTVAVISTGYELVDAAVCHKYHTCGTPDAGFGVVDLVYDIAGAIVTETIIGIGKKIF